MKNKKRTRKGAFFVCITQICVDKINFRVYNNSEKKLSGNGWLPKMQLKS